MSSDDDIRFEQDDDDVIDKDNWGKGTDVYYQNKRDKELKIDEHIEGDAEEAQRIQKELLSNLKATDFGGDEEFEQLMKKTKEAPPEETQEFQLKKFNEMIEGGGVQIEGTNEERIRIIKDMFPDVLKRIHMASKVSFEKNKEGGILGKFTMLREKIELGTVLSILTEILCKGDGRDEHPIVETCRKYGELNQQMAEMTKKIGRQTIKSFYDGTYFEQEEENQQIDKSMEEEIKENEINEDMEDDEMSFENEGIEDDEINLGEIDMEDALGDLVDEEEMKQIKMRKDLQKVNQPNIDEADKANWIDNNDFDSDEVQLEEKLLAELAANKQAQRKASGEEDAVPKRTVSLKPSKRMEREERQTEGEETKKSKRKEIENKRKLRLTKAQREEGEGQHRPVDKVVEHGRGLTRGRKPQNSRQRMRKRYEKRTRNLGGNENESKSFSYKGEKRINDDKKLSRKLDY